MRYLFTLLWMLSLCSKLLAQGDTIKVMPIKWIEKNLKEGKSQYFIFVQNKSNPNKAFTLVWQREVKKLANGKVEVKQLSVSSDSTLRSEVYSLVDAQTFLPLYHQTQSVRRGKEAYQFSNGKIIGADSVVDNKRKGFTLEAKATPFNWELDMETLCLLELKENKTFYLNFYHPGGGKPAFYAYKVTGSEKVAAIGGKPIDCWKLRIDYSPVAHATFFITKDSKELIKMEEDFGQGVRYKVKLATTVSIN